MYGRKLAQIQGTRKSKTGVYNRDSHTNNSFEIRVPVHEDFGFS